MIRTDVDSQVRVRAFEFLAVQRQTHPNAIPWRLLLEGFEYEGRRVPLVSQQGIFRPALCRLPLTLRMAWLVEGRERPYEDELAPRRSWQGKPRRVEEMVPWQTFRSRSRQA